MKNPNFKATFLKRRVGAEIYKVENTEGMTKEEILNACDRNNWGGDICGNTVTVYID